MVRFSSLVVVFLLCVASSYATKVVDVNAICKEAKDPSFCSTLLNSKPGGATSGDLVSLAQYTIDVVGANITNTIKLIKMLIAQSGNDANARAHYTNCLLFFGDDEGALGEIEDTQQYLKTGDYHGVNVHVSAIMTFVDNCISGETPDEPPYPDTSLLPKYANVVEAVAHIILVISNILTSN